MTGSWRMARLDFLTMKSQLAGYLSLVVIVLLFGFMNSSVLILCITGAWFVALMASNIFVIQEKNNLDRLYGSVSIALKDIVLGRYIFVFLSYLGSFLVIIALHAGLSLFQAKTVMLSDVMLGFSLSLLIFSTITGVQLPLFFKLGYTKAKMWSMVPFVGVMTLVVIPSFIGVVFDAAQAAMSNQGLLIAGGIAASCIVQLLSYRVSVAAYRYRK